MTEPRRKTWGRELRKAANGKVGYRGKGGGRRRSYRTTLPRAGPALQPEGRGCDSVSGLQMALAMRLRGASNDSALENAEKVQGSPSRTQTSRAE